MWVGDNINIDGRGLLGSSKDNNENANKLSGYVKWKEFLD
jgi:hypothetical protein